MHLYVVEGHYHTFVSPTATSLAQPGALPTPTSTPHPEIQIIYLYLSLTRACDRLVMIMTWIA